MLWTVWGVGVPFGSDFEMHISDYSGHLLSVRLERRASSWPECRYCGGVHLGGSVPQWHRAPESYLSQHLSSWNCACFEACPSSLLDRLVIILCALGARKVADFSNTSLPFLPP